MVKLFSAGGRLVGHAKRLGVVWDFAGEEWMNVDYAEGKVAVMIFGYDGSSGMPQVGL